MDGSRIAGERLRSTRLTGPGFRSPEEAVGWHLAMQSQDYEPAAWSIGQRSAGLTRDAVDDALLAGRIVRTHVLRPTWHFVAGEDIRWLLALSAPRVHRANATRYRQLELDARTFARAERALVRALRGGERLTRKELAKVLDDAKIDHVGQRMPYLLSHAELEAVIASGGLRGRQQTFALLDEQVPEPGRNLDRDEALREVVRRYLRSHGPATVKDLSWWSGFTIADLNRGIEALGSEAEREEIDRLTFWSLRVRGRSRAATAGLHLLQAYDETIVGYTVSRWFGDPRASDVAAAWRDPGRPTGVIVQDGRVAGHWRRLSDRDGIKIEALLYRPRPRGIDDALRREADRHQAFFGRPVGLDVRPI